MCSLTLPEVHIRRLLSFGAVPRTERTTSILQFGCENNGLLTIQFGYGIMGELLLVCWVVWPWLSYSQKRHKSKGESDANQEGYGDDYGGTAWRWQVVPVIMII